MADSKSDRRASGRGRSTQRGESASKRKSAGNPSGADSPVGRDATHAGTKADKGKAPGVQVEQQTVTEGRNGERNLRIEWVDVWIGNSKPAYFNVISAPGNQIEVVLEQLSYRKNYTAEGSLKTDIMPIVPLGTRGQLIARDLATGEVLEQKWTWINMGGPSFFSWLVAGVKKLLLG